MCFSVLETQNTGLYVYELFVSPVLLLTSKASYSSSADEIKSPKAGLPAGEVVVKGILRVWCEGHWTEL